ILSRIASTISDLNETLTELCRLVQELIPQSISTIMLVDKSDGTLRFAAGPALTPRFCRAFGPMVPSEASGSCGSAAFLRRPVIVEDTRVSPHWKNMQNIVSEFNLLACWSMPILDDQETILGTIAISHHRAMAPNPFQKNLLETAANLASIAICRKRAEERLQFAHNELAEAGRLSAMGEMASNISHELNQPLAALVNEAFVLNTLSKREPLNLDMIRKHAESLHGQAMRAAEIVSSMRSLAKKAAPTRSSVRVDEIVTKSLVLLETEIRHSGIVLEHDSRAADELVDVDIGQIQQVLVNLIRNAIEAMREVPNAKRLLMLSTDVNDSGLVVIRVADTGPGIAAKNPEVVFQAFHSTKPDGMGIGLAICRSIANAHGGTLTVKKRNPRGAEFSLLIPLSVENEDRSDT
ncbi:MAG: GAF domain-containing protein, partial [Planctomycetales bacterium]|nr:GAF domain-containing protein [Planctomycetales bacterium]